MKVSTLILCSLHNKTALVVLTTCILCICVHLNSFAQTEVSFINNAAYITYKGNLLDKSNDIILVAYFTDEGNYDRRRLNEYVMERVDSKWTTIVPLSNTCNSIVFFFKNSANNLDNNNGVLWTYVISRDKKITSIDSAQLAYNYFYTSQNQNLNNKSIINKLFSKVLKANHSIIRTKYLHEYLSSFDLRNQKDQIRLSSILDSLSIIEDLNESELYNIFTFYKKIDKLEKANATYKYILSKFPKGNYATQAEVVSAQINFWKSKEFTQQRSLYNGLVSKYVNTEDQFAKRYLTATRQIFLNYMLKYISSESEMRDWLGLVESLKDYSERKFLVLKLYDSLVIRCADQKNDWDLAYNYSLLCVEQAKSNYVSELSKDGLLRDLDLIKTAGDVYASYLTSQGYLYLQFGRGDDALQSLSEAMSIIGYDNDMTNKFYLMSLQSVKKYSLIKSTVLDIAQTGKLSGNLISYLETQKIYDTKFKDSINVNIKLATDNEKNIITTNLIKVKSPEFSVEDINGKIINLSKLQKKVVIVEFWATWCMPCVGSLPVYDRLTSHYKEDSSVVILMINEKQSIDVVTNFLNKRKNSLNIFFDKDGSAYNKFNVFALPTKFIIDRKGFVRYTSVGYDFNEEALFKKTRSLIEIVKNIDD